MARIENGSYSYCEDLRGLCSICAEYRYEVFDDLAKIIRLHIENLLVQVCSLRLSAKTRVFRQGGEMPKSEILLKLY